MAEAISGGQATAENIRVVGGSGSQNFATIGLSFDSLKEFVTRLDLSLEPELHDAVEKMCNFETVLQTLTRDVVKFKEMVQDVCFQTTALSEAFRTVFARAEQNDNIVEHHRRSNRMANHVRGRFELELEKKVLNPVKRQRTRNSKILKKLQKQIEKLQKNGGNKNNQTQKNGKKQLNIK